MNGHLLIERLPRIENQRMPSYYLSWATRLVTIGESGYQLVRTPDDSPIAEQDAHFRRCLEIIVSTWNQKLRETT